MVKYTNKNKKWEWNVSIIRVKVYTRSPIPMQRKICLIMRESYILNCGIIRVIDVSNTLQAANAQPRDRVATMHLPDVIVLSRTGNIYIGVRP